MSGPRELPPGYARIAFEVEILIGTEMTFVIRSNAPEPTIQALPSTSDEPPREIGQ